jgi:transcriptional regulator with XRE-family HTH domain
VASDSINGPEQVFGRRMKAERFRLGWRLEDLAARTAEHGLGLHPSAYSKIEAGQRLVRLGEAVAISRTLGIPLHFMLSESTVTEAEAELEDIKARLAQASAESDAQLQQAAWLWNEARLLQTRIARERGEEEGA